MEISQSEQKLKDPDHFLLLKNSLKLQPKPAFKSGKSRRMFEIYDSMNIQSHMNRDPTKHSPLHQTDKPSFQTIDNKQQVEELNLRRQELQNSNIYTLNPYRYDNKVPWRLSKDMKMNGREKHLDVGQYIGHHNDLNRYGYYHAV